MQIFILYAVLLLICSHIVLAKLGVKWLFSFCCIFKKHQQRFLAVNIADRLCGGIASTTSWHNLTLDSLILTFIESNIVPD